jgi:hypothetical protein
MAVNQTSVWKVRFKPALTPGGFAVLAVALIILIRSLLARNPFEILLSSAALLVLFIFWIIGAWKSRKLKYLEPGWKQPFPMTANAGEASLITGLDAPVPLFFRLHFVVRGRFFPAGYGNGHRVLVETSVSGGTPQALLPLDFPVSGIFQGNGFCQLRDIFGFFSFLCGTPQQRTIKVRSAPWFGKNFHINAQSGAEDRRNKNSSDEERYYMREYTPGDRFRDINWKSSEKIDSLITRISPDNQEKVSRIEIYFRNYGPVYSKSGKTGSSAIKTGRKKQKPSLEELWLLDRAKARLSQFLRSLKEEQSSYIFHVRTAEKSWEIEDTNDLEDFLEELAGISFSLPQNESLFPAGTLGDLYVFSTVCDLGLPGFLLSCSLRPITLFLVQQRKQKSNEKYSLEQKPIRRVPDHVQRKIDSERLAMNKERETETENETLYVRDFALKGCIPPPRWLIRRNIKPLGANAGRVEIIFAETKL